MAIIFKEHATCASLGATHRLQHSRLAMTAEQPTGGREPCQAFGSNLCVKSAVFCRFFQVGGMACVELSSVEGVVYDDLRQLNEDQE